MDGSVTYDQYFNSPQSPLNNSVRQPGLNFEQQYQIQNSFLDQAGVISSSNFAIVGTVNPGFFFTTDTSGTVVVSQTLISNIVITRPTNVLFFYGGQLGNQSVSGHASIYLNIDGSVPTYFSQILSNSGSALTLTNFHVETLSIGTHTTNLTIANSGGVGTAYIYQGGISYIRLGN